MIQFLKRHSLFLFLFFIPSIGLSQVTHPASEKESQTTKINQYYESLLQDILEKYYDEELFVIDVKVDLKENLPQSPDTSVNPQNDELEDLPGLPVPLQSNPESRLFSQGGKNLAPAWAIEKIDIEVLIDTGYGARAKTFIKNLVSMAADINLERGDKVIVNNGIFPNKYIETKPMPQISIVAHDTSKKSRLEIVPTNPFQAYIDNLASLIPLIIVCLLVLLVVWMVSRALSQRKGAEEEKYKTLLQEIHALKSQIPTATSPNTSSAPTTNEWETLRSFLISALVGNPASSAQTLRSWITDNASEGIKNIARLFRALDKNLLITFENEFNQEIFREIKLALTEDFEIDETTLITLGNKFKNHFVKLTQSDISESKMHDLFGFMNQLNEIQISHLLKDEPEGMIGLTLAQVDPQLASKLLQKFEPSQRARILGSMGKLDNLSVKVYKELAERLSKKALQVINMRYVASDGIDTVLKLLDHLPVSLQEEYLNNLAETDLNLAEKIRKYFVTLPEVSLLPDQFLGQFIRKVDQELLILALIKADTPLKDKILSVLPERMQQMVLSGIESRQDVKEEASEIAQQKFLSSLREELKASGGRPE